uniref:F-box domain-containing protein n=1 Tax=Steinernema glaseri TaxID=37863 RepID=A0A1I7XWV7_9BILA
MDSVPTSFIERVTGILSKESLRVLQGAEATLGRWASAHSTYTKLELNITINRDGKKYFCCNSRKGFLGFEDVLSLWNSATCHFEKVEFSGPLSGPFQSMSGNHFNAFKKMIARQRRQIRSLEILHYRHPHLVDEVVQILKLCGGAEQLYITTDITPFAPILKKLISDGGVHVFMLHNKPFPDWLVPTLTMQIQVGILKRIVLRVDDDELGESLIHMAMNHILKQEHEEYTLSHPEKYVPLIRPLEEELKYVPSKADYGETHYSHPEKHTKVIWTSNSYGFFYSWKTNQHY